MREILIAVTFREFNGDVNSKIQDLFLESIRKQTYQKVRLIVTNFKEKTVKKRIEESGLPFEWHQSKTPNIWHSFTEVFGNLFKHLEKNKNILLYTNADNIFEPNFFEEVVRNFQKGSGGTSYPHMTYLNIEDYKRGVSVDTYYYRRIKSFYQLDPNLFVPDVIYIDGDIMLNENNRNLFLKHYISGAWPGMAQTLMIAMYAKDLKNLIYKSKVANIQNIDIPGVEIKRNSLEKKGKRRDLTVGMSSKQKAVQDVNYNVMLNFCKESDIPRRYWDITFLRKLRQHKKYKVVGSIFQRAAYELYFYYYGLLHTFKKIPKVSKKLFSLIS